MPVFTEKQLNRIAMLGALSLFLSTVEYLFPRPIPFMRLGLANLPVILCLDLISSKTGKAGEPGEFLPLRGYFLLILLKVLGQGMVNGTMASYIFLFSISGSFASGLIMLLAWRFLRPDISFLGVSILGALVSNMAQILLSIIFIFGASAWRILPWFLGIGLISGLLIGLFAQRFSKKSRWWAAIKGGRI
ncbi:MAG: heptaprenyl diphosphate synthase [Spirochaetaceae bacterium 4572_59]|nr:MAG: heptaprenyl diphosphate synthase [Spirochaetaceae bacterium 4572_59]